MSEVMLALKRSLTTLGRGRVWLYMLVPTLLTLLVMVVLALFLLDNLVTAFIEQPPMSWIAGSRAAPGERCAKTASSAASARSTTRK